MRWLAVVTLMTGCTAESARIAIDTQRRVDDVQQTVFDRQHDGLRVLLFRDLVHRVGDEGEELAPEQVDVLNTVWNERDLMEFWALQNERALGLRRVGVDAKVYGEQAVVDLLWKSLEAKVKRGEQAVASAKGAAAAAAANRAAAERAAPDGGAANGESQAEASNEPQTEGGTKDVDQE